MTMDAKEGTSVVVNVVGTAPRWRASRRRAARAWEPRFRYRSMPRYRAAETRGRTAASSCSCVRLGRARSVRGVGRQTRECVGSVGTPVARRERDGRVAVTNVLPRPAVQVRESIAGSAVCGSVRGARCSGGSGTAVHGGAAWLARLGKLWVAFGEKLMMRRRWSSLTTAANRQRKPLLQGAR